MSKYRNLRTPAILLSAALLVSGASGCSQSASAAGLDSGRLSIVCTIFPEYDWVKCIMGDKAANADITYLLDNGIDLHNYSPSADDIVRISGCD
ncbi:MAG: zinc ABC transporter substrate-binding protein, partial [Ruminiclostridium sp.]|nr:zinc ABC transporter substrate-binding protein [Ruminiclostridium sp.]